MKENILQKNYNHENFGGIICASDFETDYRGEDSDSSSIADRIISDWRFDKRCYKNSTNRENQSTYNKNREGK